MLPSPQYLLFAILLLTAVSSCEIDNLLSIPYGEYELSSIDFANYENFRPDYYSGDGVLMPGECESYTDLQFFPDRPIEYCFPENNFLHINQGLTYELAYVIHTRAGFVQSYSSGEFQYGDEYLRLSLNNGSSTRVSYTDNELRILGSDNVANLVFDR